MFPPLSRIVALTLAFALTIVIVPVQFVHTVQAADFDMPEDPVDTAIAPHFSRIVYALEEPAYSTSCDDRGYFKVSVGTPSVTVSDSRLVVSATATTKSCVVLARSDVAAINQTRAYYEICLKLSNTLAYANVSLWDTATNDWVNISAQAGAWYYDYDSGTQQKGVLYALAAANTDYVLGFELTTTSVTLYLYSSVGVLLADKYIATARLVGGDLDEIRFELAGSTSNSIYIDYLFVSGTKPASTGAGESATLDIITADKTLSEDRLDLDPTALTLEQSLREEMFGFGMPEITSTEMTREELIRAIGYTEIHQQRAAGRLVAEGYTSLRDSVEDQVVAYIATLEGVDEADVYLVDYYIDYMQMKLKVHSEIADKVSEVFEANAEPALNALGFTLEEARTASVLSVPARAECINWSYLLPTAVWIEPFLTDSLRGVTDVLDDPLGLEGAAEQWADYLADQQKKVEDLYNSALARADWTYNQTIAAVQGWQESTEEKYNQVYGLLLNYMSVSQAQFTQLTDNYEEAQDRFERTISSYYAYTAQQFEMTNQVVASLLLQNQDLSEASTELTQYFAGELAQTNEVIMNLTSTLVSQLDATSVWTDVMDSGKVADEPLTFSSFFGNTLQTWVWVFVVAFVCIVVVAVLLSLGKGRQKGRSKS